MAPTLVLALAIASLVSCVVVQFLQKKRNTKGHPLPPGPPPLPFVGNAIGIDTDRPWLTYSKWGTEYGEIVYSRLFSQDVVIINSERIARDLLDRRSHNYSTRPPELKDVLDFFSHDYSSTFLPYSDKWRLRYIPLKAVTSFRPIQMRHAHRLIINLLASSEVYGTHFYTFSTSIIMSIMYDYAIAPIDDTFLKLIQRSLEIDIKVFRPEVAAFLTEFPILKKLPAWLPGASFVRDAIVQRTLASTIVDMPFEHVKNNMASSKPAGTAAPSVVSNALNRMLVKTEDEGEAAVLEEGIKEASATGYAGSTTSTLCIFLLAMVLYPEVQARAQAEIDSIIGETLERLPDWDDRASLPYINAVILETLRWFPVAPLGVAHAAVNEDIYEGYYIPKGQSNIIISSYARFMSRNPDKYPNPSRFIPERHMSKVNPADISFVFGFGRRVCAGRHVADASLFAAIVNILAVFRVERAPGWNIGPDAEGVKWTGGLTT
ncbi:cytochrome P450 [Suillus discolor]|uniref:Cytochrome P450 n=1 Tax=Suillus discolor TaxID=1912936 RepID=A0A9P7EX37_9AGAM|nr:cytochrome P450 [Suillus discolor]KAG2093328.1 cytochrome P450 [Suillus discolor]